MLFLDITLECLQPITPNLAEYKKDDGSLNGGRVILWIFHASKATAVTENNNKIQF